MYLVWEAEIYTINISMNTKYPTADGSYVIMNNYNKDDSGYFLYFNDIENKYAIDNNTVLTYTEFGGKNDYISFNVKFDDSFDNAIDAMYRRLNTLGISASGYKYMALNTNYVTNDINNVKIVDNGLLQDVRFTEQVYNMMYYEKVDYSNNVIVTINALNETIVNTGTLLTVNPYLIYEGMSHNKFTLFASYDTQSYDISVRNSTENENRINGAYQLVNTVTASIGFSQAVDQKVRYFLNENIVTIPLESGRTLSKLIITYVNEHDEKPYRLEVDISFRSAMDKFQNKVVIEGFTLFGYDEENDNELYEICKGALESNGKSAHYTINKENVMTKSEDLTHDTLDLALSYVFNSIQVTTFNEKFTLDGNEIEYADRPADTQYVVVTLGNIKTNMTIACEYEPQKFQVQVDVLITDGQTPTPLDGSFTEHLEVEYGQTIYDVITEWDIKLETIGEAVKVGWFVNDSNDLITDEEKDSEINSSMHLVCKFTKKANSSKKVVFYSWDSTNNHYKEYENNKNYVLYSTKYTYGDGGSLTESAFGYIGGTWVGVDNSQYINTTYNTLKSIPAINAWYPNYQLICYVIFNNSILSSLGYNYMAEFTEQKNVYLEVVSYNNSTKKATVKFVGAGHGDMTLNVLTTTTTIGSNIYAVPAYAKINFSGTSSALQLSFSSSTVTTSATYKNRITFFEVLNDSSVIFYNSDKVRYMALTDVAYQKYLYARSLGATPATALTSLIGAAGTGIWSGNTSQVINTGTYKYLFAFFYKYDGYNWSDSTIIAVADRFVDLRERNYHDIRDNLAFTANSVSTSLSSEEEGTMVTIDRTLMYNTFYGQSGSVSYPPEDICFALLTTQQFKNFLKANGSREEKLMSVINSATIIKDQDSFVVTSDVYILAYHHLNYSHDKDVCRCSSNVVYVNATDQTTKLIFIQDIVFTDSVLNNAIEESTNAFFTNTSEIIFPIKTDLMFTSTYDSTNGKTYSVDTDLTKFRFALISGDVLKKISDGLTNGYHETDYLFKKYIISNNMYSISSTGYTFTFSRDSASTDTVDNTRYLLAFYKDGDHYVTAANIIKISFTIEHSDPTDLTSSEILSFENTKIITLSNDFSFTIAAVDEKKVANNHIQYEIDSDYINSNYTDYVTNTQLNSNLMKYLVVSGAELAQINDYYTNGATFGEHVYENLTLEEAFMLTIYYWRYRTNSTKVSIILDILRNGSYDNITDVFKNIAVDTPNYISTINLKGEELIPERSYTDYVIAYVPSTTINNIITKISSNVIKIAYDVDADRNIVNNVTSVLGISSF